MLMGDVLFARINDALQPERICHKLGYWELQSWQVSPELYQRCIFHRMEKLMYMSLT